MKRWRIPLGLFVVMVLIAGVLTIPVKRAYTFTETRTEHPKLVYWLLEDESEFQIRYIHSIFLTNVLETYRVLPDSTLKFLTMRYEDVGIGLPAYAEKGETLEVTNDGIYTLTYEDKEIDSFILYIGDIDAQLAFRYKGIEADLKAYLKRGHSYEFCVKKLTVFELMKGVNMNGKAKKRTESGTDNGSK
ncbi:DUF1850 domain-containing protein [Sporosarcina sp. BI001-red]|uniref:DUF1850 domain-containing protein n=1 Tax=Sporosarcina sp. BI001-red TaxID=2282866 RepID=UPI000E26200B|nr:DUF1850 domain-containing protein [Sporosarcina sp. BI001-red]REB09577.1 DUF1850 domain-containing protein [Sporosarcina sp. BI001-red]